MRNEDSAQRAPPAVPTGEDLTRAVLACLHPWKLDAHVDSLVEKYGISKPTYDIGIGLSIPVPSEVSHGESDWSVGSKYTASRLMSLVAMIWAVLSKEKKSSMTDEDVLQLVTFFCSDGLANSVGPSFCNPSLSHVSNFWQDSVPEVQQAARSVFRGLISRLPRKKKEIMYKEWALRVDAGTSIPQDGSRVLSDIALRNTLLLGIIGSDEGDEE
ncbi:hypothetical protein M427DRAFT_371086 [Gonapodya prolifera JEL478]|uniref:Uncharacterized protein n=1 Tax=Gonapodya prolifera (strain JEL478) TaxID=1344416 RepID=A0A139A9H4_GONPJ|nr:hypothetical protein M427DRAFT_371086 [Gonapodya prolifera JEL478]|eukprot:KXS13397.1 hypothetical protein M427DRAFT_371086 [Gonapodya prolifera JEL478]